MKLIDANTLKAEFTGNFQNEYTKAEIHALIDLAPTIGGWISVKDRMPEHGKRYIIYATSADGQEHHISIASFGGRFHLLGRRTYWKVTHYIPLPEPPKENEDE